MSRISSAFRSFFALLFRDELPEDIALAYGYTRKSEVKTAPPPVPKATPVSDVRTSDGALQLLGIF
ncbi:MAG TPA: hypothetical protein VES20_20895, partial [Bryobacteraceae bacterium]|nr:hypothetical protein [Bryobacteraceae bacterium]